MIYIYDNERTMSLLSGAHRSNVPAAAPMATMSRRMAKRCTRDREEGAMCVSRGFWWIDVGTLKKNEQTSQQINWRTVEYRTVWRSLSTT